MILPRFAALFATLAIGVLAVQGKSKSTSPASSESTPPKLHYGELWAANVANRTWSEDVGMNGFDTFLSEFFLIEGMKPFAMNFDVHTHVTDDMIWEAGEEAVKDVLALAKDETILPFVAIALGFLNGWDETKGIYFGVCQTFSIRKSTFGAEHYIGAKAGKDQSQSFAENLSKATGHTYAIDNSPAALQVLKDLKATRAQEASEDAKAAAAYYAKQGNEPESEVGQESKMSDPGAKKGDKKEKADKKEKGDKKSGSKHARRGLPIY